jgi:hypothetical protein
MKALTTKPTKLAKESGTVSQIRLQALTIRV